MSRVRYLLLTAGRTRSPLAPLVVSLLVLGGVFGYPDNEVGGTWGLTALLAGGLAAWFVGAVLAAEPTAQAEMATVALGGRRGRERLDGLLILIVAGLLSALLVAVPTALALTSAPDLFGRSLRVGDVVGAVLAHVSCTTLGGAIAVLFAPPRLRRRASSVAAVVAALIGVVAVAEPLGVLGGPVAVAEALTNARAGAVSGSTLVACASTLVAAALALAVAGRWARRWA